jgi:acyl-coenzyme A synthetase/AMP-(fatty) acid ligase
MPRKARAAVISEQISEWAKRAPDRTALIHNGAPLSYGSFARCIAAARGALARRGCVGPGFAVVALHNLRDFWICSLALRSLGLTTAVAWSPAAMADLALPDVRYVVASAAESWPGLEGACATKGLHLLSIAPNGECEPDLEFAHAPDPPGGHILLTSGTTGTHKMVLVSPAIDTDFIRTVVDMTGMTRDTVLSVFDFPPWTGIGYKGAASPWLVGGATLFEQGREPHRALLRPGLTHAVIVPAMIDAILAQPADAFPRNDALRLYATGGPMTRTQVDRAKARITAGLFNLLASTEAGGIALTPLDTPEDHRWHRLVDGRAVQIVDDLGRAVPIGESGRLRVGTAGGPTGYLHDETATRDFFKDGFFYPGDLAVMRADGRMALQGRLTDVINVRGHKISAASIEQRLCDILGVTGVCIFSMQNDGGEEEVHVAIETATPIESERLTSVLVREFRAFGRAHVHRVAALPRNHMRKVVRRAVRELAVAGRLR